MTDLTTRSKNVLSSMIYDNCSFWYLNRIYPDDVAGFTETDILSWPNSGKVTLANIKVWLSDHGQTLKPDSSMKKFPFYMNVGG